MKNFFTLGLLLLCIHALSQNGGNNVFQFLTFSSSARVEATGGYLLTVVDDDASLGVENPALLNPSMHGNLTINYVNYFANSNYGYASYTKHYRSLGTFNGSLLYANYGKFEYAESDGTRNGAIFNANDLVASVAYGRKLDSNFSIGGDIRFAASFLEAYNAFGMSVDFGVVYQKKSKGLATAFMLKNAGVQLKSYVKGNRKNIPLNPVIAISKKLAHAPFRFSLTYDNIHRWNLVYFDPNQQQTKDPLTGDPLTVKEPGVLKKAMYHITLGGEMLFAKSFNLQFGFNYKNRQDLAVAARKGMAGFSWGFGLQLKKFKLSYGMGKYHIAGTSNHITLSTRIGKKVVNDGYYIQDEDL